MDKRGVILQGIDLLDVLRFVMKKNKKYQATLLNAIEELFNDDPEAKVLFYGKIRKLYLDSQNNYTREILKVIFGDIEYLIK